MEYGKHQAPARYESGEGCLTTLIRIPVRIVVLVVVLPVRMVWDALAATWHAAERVLLRPLGRALAWLCDVLVVIPSAWLYRTVLTPLGHALLWLATALFVRLWTGLWRYLVVPLVRYGLVVPLVWLYGAVLTPLGHGLTWLYRSLLAPAGRGIGTALGWLLTTVFVRPVVGLWRYVVVPLVRYGLVVPVVWLYGAVLTPVGHGISWLLALLGRGLAAVGNALATACVWLIRTLLVVPVSWVYTRVLVPVCREIGTAIGVAWRVAGYLSRAVGRALAWLAWHLVGAPVAWVYRTVCTPVGHFVRDAVWAPAKRAAVEAGQAARGALRAARESVRQARRDAWRALVGGGPDPRAGEQGVVAARTLGGAQQTTTVPSAAQAPEISPLGERFTKRG
ncbi:hypothetical protein AB0L68_14800 [Streptomyces sp. NPDC052164]|uniref:hypothetical protein n=1 Tax=Streptomyces sp. NPDC052164 TaxID=3155529 RepID=UPI0034250952